MMIKNLNTALKVSCCVFLSSTLLVARVQAQQSLWVGQTFKCEVSPLGTWTNMTWTQSSSLLNMTGSSLYRNVTPTRYYGGSVTVTCSYKYKLYSSGSLTSASKSWTFTCNSNPLKVSNTSINISPGETASIAYGLTYTNSYSGSATFSFNGYDPSIVSVSSYGVVTAKSPGKTYVQVSSTHSANQVSVLVTVSDVDVKSVSIPSSSTCLADGTVSLKATPSPNNATVKSTVWTSSNPDVATVNPSTGVVTGITPGKSATIYCTVNGSVRSNDCVVSVEEPTFSLKSTSPSDGFQGQTVFVIPSMTYSLALSEGNCYSSIALRKSDDSQTVDGSVSMIGSTVTFTPSHPLEPLTDYVLSIPANAVKNKWGTHYDKEETISFRTASLEKLTLTSSNTNKFLTKGDKIRLSASKSEAKIYYTTNGRTPTAYCDLYTNELILERDIKLRAIAICDGYENSDVLSYDYYLSNVAVKDRYPDENTILYLYKDVNPHIKFSNKIETSENIGGIVFLKNNKEDIGGEVIVADSTIFIVPDEPMDLGCTYSISIPDNAIVTCDGEPNVATSWTFSTGDYSTSIAHGHEIAAAIKTDKSLLTWGQIYKSGNSSDGSYTSEYQAEPQTFISSDVSQVSAGFMHNAIIKEDHSLWMWGRQYCGEIGNNSTAGSATPIKVMENVKSVSCGGQTTAIVKNDGTLWMAGRNDFGQIGDGSYVARKSPVQIMSDIQTAQAGWCTTYAVKNDGTLLVWGRNDKGQIGDGTTENRLEPIEVMKDVSFVASSSSESNCSAAVKSDGSLWVWGNGKVTPTMIDDNVCSVAIEKGIILYVKKDGSLYRYYGDRSIVVGNGVTDIATAGVSSLALRDDGSVWSVDESGLGSRIVKGRSVSELAGIEFESKAICMPADSKNVIAHRPIALDANYGMIQWSSSDEDIVSVSSRGVLTSHSPGSAEVTATISDVAGKLYYAVCDVEVIEEGQGNNIFVVDKDGNDVSFRAVPGDDVSIFDSYRSIEVETPIDNLNISYIRNFANSSDWQALFLPFDINVENDLSDFDVAELDASLSCFSMIVINKLTSGILSANTPYFIRLKEGGKTGEQTISVTNATIKATDDTSFRYGSVKLTGIYKQMNGTEMIEQGAYALSGGRFCQALDGSAKLGAFRFYLTGVTDDVKFFVADETTGILGEVSSRESNSSTYNIQGQVVNDSYKGIVIKNGKKVIRLSGHYGK